MERFCDCGNEGFCDCPLRRRSLTDRPIVYTRRRFMTRLAAADSPTETASTSSSNFANLASTVGAPPSSTAIEIEEEKSDTDVSDSSSSSDTDTSLSHSGEDETSEEEEEGGEVVVQPSRENVPPNSSNANGDGTIVGPTKDRPVGLLLSLKDPSVLKCPICTFPLSLPVYQCENGHIACASCCLNWENKCSFFRLEIGYNRCRAIEKVIESIKSSCRYMEYGCVATFSYCKRRAYERKCSFQPCWCPHIGCEYKGMYKELYDHSYSLHHFKGFLFNSSFYIRMHKDGDNVIFQESNEKIIFVVKSILTSGGNLVIVYCFAPPSFKSEFKYKISTYCRSIRRKAFVKKIPEIIPNIPLQKFLFFPTDYVTHNFLLLKLTIWNHEGLHGTWTF